MKYIPLLVLCGCAHIATAPNFRVTRAISIESARITGIQPWPAPYRDGFLVQVSYDEVDVESGKVVETKSAYISINDKLEKLNEESAKGILASFRQRLAK